MGVIAGGSERSRPCGAAAFQTDRDHAEVLVRIAKVRLAKTMKIKGHVLDNVAWDILDARQADRELDRIGGAAPEAADQKRYVRLHGHLTEEEFDLVLEPKASWEPGDTREDPRRLERQRVRIQNGS